MPRFRQSSNLYRCRFDTIGVSVSKYAAALAARNPWTWYRLSDSSGTIAESALPVQPGWGGSSWNGFPMPPPGHPQVFGDADVWPLGVNGSGNTYGISGATSDGATAMRFNGGEYYSASFPFNFNCPAFPNVSSVYWIRSTGAGAGGIVYGWLTQFSDVFEYCGAGFMGAVVYDDSGHAVEVDWAVNWDDGQWHLAGMRWTNATNAQFTAELFLDGVSQGAKTGTGSFLSTGTQATSFVVGRSGSKGPVLSNVGLQHLALFPSGVSACDQLAASDYAALYGAR